MKTMRNAHCRLFVAIFIINFHVYFTAKSFIELVQYLFTIPGVHSFLSQRICQIEKFFGCQRQRGGTHDNPNAQEFLKNTQAFRVFNSVSKGPVRGNCRGTNSPFNIDMEKENKPLPKRSANRRK